MDTTSRLDQLSLQFDGLARLAGAILGDAAGGEDVAQETLIRALGSDRQPTRSDEVRPWLRTIARRLALSERQARRSRADRERSRGGAPAAPSTEEIAARAESAERLHAVVRGLSPAHSAVLLARYVGGHSPAAIAARDGVPVNTVKARLRRAKVELRAALERDGLGTDEHWSIAIAPLAALAVKSRPAEAGALGHAAGLLLGASMMTKILVPLAAAASLLVGLVLLRGDTPGPMRSPAERTMVDGTEALGPATIEGDASRSREGASAEPGAAAPTIAGAHALLRGIVTDADGEPIEDVEAVLEAASHDGTRWVHDAVQRARTDEEGAWSFSMPLDGTPPARVRFTPGAFHQTATIKLSPEPRDGRVTLREGEVDAGTTVLAAAGVAIGRVVDAAGAPLDGVRIELQPSFNTHYGLVGETACRSRADGSFELAHGPVGIYSMTFRHDGHVSRIIDTTFTARNRTDLGVVGLEHAEEVGGVVLDDEGSPVPHQSFVLYPTRGSDQRG